MKMSDDEHASIQLDGAAARAANQSRFENPFLKSENMPAATGETVEEWTAKWRAWGIGWQAEDLLHDVR